MDEKSFKKNPQGWASRWASEIAYAKQHHSNWKKKGKEANTQFLAKDTSTTDPSYSSYRLNLFTSNITTMMSMLYGKIPQVSVDRRWADANDQVARVASEMATRILNTDIEASGDDYSCVMRSCLQDRLLPGIGIARVKYDLSSSESVIPAVTHPETGEELAPEVRTTQIDDEWVDELYVHWDDILWSPVRYWSEMRWIAFRTYMDRDDLVKRFGSKIGKQVPLNSKSPMDEAGAKGAEIWSKAEVWEIWDKDHRHVFWYVDGFPQTLDDKDDFLKLDDFFPCPSFFIANTTTSDYVPKSDWSMAQSLYREIDNLEERIALLTSAVKVVGVYDKKQQDLARLVNETAENKLIPVDNWAMFAEKGGLKGAVDFFPLEQVVEALAQLQQQQQARIAQLYQITGMADILRGDSSQPTSATADALKAKFASIRIQSIQDEFARFATDLQKLKFEIICKHFQLKTIISKSNILLTNDSKMAVEAAKFLKHPSVAQWRIHISPESMAMTDYAQLRQERTEYINALGIFLQSSAPIAQMFPGASSVLLQLLKWGLAGFKGSREIEGVLDQGIAQIQKQQQASAMNPQPPQPSPEQIKATAEQQKQQAEAQRSSQEHQQEMEQTAFEHQTEMQQTIAETSADIQKTRAKVAADVLKARASGANNGA